MMNLLDKELTARELPLPNMLNIPFEFIHFELPSACDLPKRYIINDGAIVLFWNDGTKTIVKRAKDDTDDVVKGFLWAYFEKMSGMSKTQANKYLKDIASSRSEIEVI